MQIGTKMSTKKIESKSEFEKFIKEEISKLKALMESETVSKTIDPLKVDMKQGDKVSKSEESALVYKDPSGKKTKKGGLKKTSLVAGTGLEPVTFGL